jgi:hypothetical protein
MTKISLAAVFALGLAAAFGASSAGAAEDEIIVSDSSTELQAADCGEKGQKPCPMQAWMKATMQAASTSGDGAKLAAALEYTAARAPSGMDQWKRISDEGAAAAKKGDIEGAKKSCKTCHDMYKAKYKKSAERNKTF